MKLRMKSILRLYATNTVKKEKAFTPKSKNYIKNFSDLNDINRFLWLMTSEDKIIINILSRYLQVFFFFPERNKVVSV